MTYIPDCRTDEEYNVNALNDMDREFVRGFDWCTEMAVDNFFDNIDDLYYESDFLRNALSTELPEHLQGEYEAEYTFVTDEDGKPKTETRQVKTYEDFFRSKLLDWIENERDELITSMIDNMAAEKEA